jgi:hypothetical protein
MIRWMLGFIVGGVWGAANLAFTLKILKISVLKGNPGRLSALLMLKFPVLYLAGFLILISKAFPVASLLAGMTVALIIMGISRLWLKRV